MGVPDQTPSPTPKQVTFPVSDYTQCKDEWKFIYVISYDGKDTIYAQMDADKTNDILDKVEKYLYLPEKIRQGQAGLLNLTVGSPCLALSKVDGGTYRARIVQVLGNEMFEIFFVDYGGTEVVAEKDISLCPNDLVDDCPEGITLCKLKDFTGDESPDEVAKFQKNVEGGELHAKIEGCQIDDFGNKLVVLTLYTEDKKTSVKTKCQISNTLKDTEMPVAEKVLPITIDIQKDDSSVKCEVLKKNDIINKETEEQVVPTKSTSQKSPSSNGNFCDKISKQVEDVGVPQEQPLVVSSITIGEDVFDGVAMVPRSPAVHLDKETATVQVTPPQITKLRDQVLTDKDKELEIKAEQLNEREAKIRDQKQNLNIQQGLLSEREKHLDQKNGELTRKEQELKKVSEEIKQKEDLLNQREHNISKREEDLERKQGDLLQKEQNLGEREEEIKQKEANVAQQQQMLIKKEEDLKEKENKLLEEDRKLEEREGKIEESKADAAQQYAELMEKKKEDFEQSVILAAKEKELKQLEDKLAEEEKIMHLRLADKDQEHQLSSSQMSETFLTQLKNHHDEYKTRLQDKDEEIKRLNTMISNKACELGKLNQELIESKQDNENLRSSNNDLQSELEKVKSEISEGFGSEITTQQSHLGEEEKLQYEDKLADLSNQYEEKCNDVKELERELELLKSRPRTASPQIHDDQSPHFQDSEDDDIIKSFEFQEKDKLIDQLITTQALQTSYFRGEIEKLQNKIQALKSKKGSFRKSTPTSQSSS